MTKESTKLILTFIITFIVSLLIGIIFISNYKTTVNTTNNPTNNWEVIINDSNANLEKISICVKSDNCCEQNSDCQYVQVTGGCQTPEFVKKVMDNCKAKTGPCPLEAKIKEGITCTCENNRCVTHN